MALKEIVAMVGTYPPRPCGIATFTRDLCDAVSASPWTMTPRVAAIERDGAHYHYPSRVRWRIDQPDASSWRAAARAIDRADVAVVCVQHEFGLFGHFADGRLESDYLPNLLNELHTSVVVTLHTVLPHPGPDIREAVRRIGDCSEAVVTMAQTAQAILEEAYEVPPRKLHVIPHGVPRAPAVSMAAAKRRLDIPDRMVLMTFGLLSEGKGIHFMIQALPQVLRWHPEVLYLVVGQTHPEVRRQEGERYRDALVALTHRLRLDSHVRFVDRHVSQDQLLCYLQATDIYVTPYVNPDQITSGTLAYALGAGKAVVSTPYLYAVEALADGRGLLAQFADPESLACCVCRLLEEPLLRRCCECRALAYARTMAWDAVAARYVGLFRQLAGDVHADRRAAPPLHARRASGKPPDAQSDASAYAVGG